MKILALNCGSSTVKYQLFEISPELIRSNEDRVVARGSVDRIGKSRATVSFEVPGREPIKSEAAIPDHRHAVEVALACLADPEDGVLDSIDEIDGIGHRVVHGGEYYSDSVLIDEDVARRIEECAALAPLHNPHNLQGYLAVHAALPERPQVAVFDTAFHQTLKPHAFLFGIPYHLYQEHRIRRYGFHGTSHRFVSERLSELRGPRPGGWKTIVCHLGSGASLCAVDNGRSVDMSMGFTPLDGLMMGTRPGQIDPGVLLHLMATHDLKVEDLTRILNHESGLLGISGISNDMRTLVRDGAAGNERASLAIDVFCYRVKKYIGSLYAVLNGADSVVFTGGIGENQPVIRSKCCEALSALGIAVDTEKNEATFGQEADISAEGAATSVWVVPTNEELLIARETVRLIS
jgi:acetate kinase